MISSNKEIFLFGGLSRQLLNSVDSFSSYVEINQDTKKYVWKQIDPLNDNIALIPQARFGHTLNYLKNDLIIFGGAGLYNRLSKSRECFNTFYSFHLESRKWEEIKCGGVALEPRRNHVSCIIGRNFIINGGIDEHGNYLLDTMATSLQETNYGNKIAKWSHLFCKGEGIGNVAYHACQLVLSQDKYSDPNLSLFFIPESKTIRNTLKVK